MAARKEQSYLSEKSYVVLAGSLVSSYLACQELTWCIS